jgi:catalase (peroxidase I)
MMLPIDLALIQEPAFRKWVEVYAKDEDKFFKVSATLIGRRGLTSESRRFCNTNIHPLRCIGFRCYIC